MPLGPFADWGSCISAQKRKGYSDDAAKGICGKIEQNTIAARKASTPAVVKYEDNNDHLYLKAFLLNQDINKRYWGVSQSSLERNASSFIGKPLILNWNEAQNVFDHPDIPLNALEHKADENGFVSIADYVDHWLAYQEPYRIGTIVDVVNKGSTYSAIIEVTDPDAKRAFRKHELPLFVSPGVAHLNPYHESATSMEDWTGIHLAIVTNPAYTIQKAYVSNQCNGDSDSCLLQLREASLSQSRYNYNDSPNLVYGQCGFCRKKALDAYFEQVNFPIDPSITGVLHWASTYQEFIDSSHNSKAQTQNKMPDNIPTLTIDTQSQPEQNQTNQDTQVTNPTIAEKAYKVANMEKCVQVFAQHGINPEQAQQICQIAMETMTESSGNPAGNNQQNGPPISGQYGSTTTATVNPEMEKELEKKQATIEKLAEELKSYKKNVKTEAERIAELETQVQNFQLEKKHNVLDQYLAKHIADEAIRQEKVKKFAAKDLTVEDLREIYEDIPAKAKQEATTEVTAKTASVQEQQPKPKGKVQLRTASTDESNQNNDTNKSNKIRDTNSKLVSSFFANSGGN